MKYQFQSNPGEFSYKPRLFTNAIKVLISVNFIIFILQTLSRSETLFFPLFGLVPKLVWSEKMIWQPVTYLFFHGGIWHVLINMFVLWMFGSELERLWGKNHFLIFYFIITSYSDLFLNIKFKKVSKATFDLYKKYLSSKNLLHFTHARRSLMGE